MLEWPVIVDDRRRRAILEALAQRRPHVQLIRGPAGIGKTSLAESISAALQEAGATVLPVVAVPELRGVALGAMAPAISTLGAVGAGTVGERLQQLFGLLAADVTRYVLVVDDAPLLDEVSASIIHQLVRAAGVRAVMAARDGAPLPGPIARLAEEGLLDLTELEGVDRARAGELVEVALGGQVDPDSLRRLLTAAGGNPLFLRELVRWAVDNGRVKPGPFGLTIDTVGVPAVLTEGLRIRFDELPPHSLDAARLLALAESWPETALAETAAVEELLSSGLARRSDAGRLYLAHPLVAEALLAGMSTEQLNERRTEAATRLAALPDDASRFMVITLLAETERAIDPEQLVWAARFAHAMTDHVTAVALAERALAQDPSFEAYQVLAVGLSALRRSEAAVTFAEAATAASTEYERALIARDLGHHLAISLQLPSDALLVEEGVLQSLVDPAARAVLDDDIGRWRLVLGEQVGREPEDSGTLASAVYEVMRATQSSDFARARVALDRARPLAVSARLDSPSVASMLDLYEFRMLVYQEGFGPGGRFADEHRTDLLSEDVGMWSQALALVALHEGRIEDARREAEAAVEQLRWRDPCGVLAVAVAIRATVAAQLGRREPALELLRAEPTGDMKEGLQRAEAAAWIRALDGELSSAAEIVVAAGQRAARVGALAIAAPTVYLAVRFGQAHQAVALLHRIDGTAQSPLMHAMAKHAEAAAAGDPAALLRAARKLAEVRLLAGAVDAAADAMQRFATAGRREDRRKAELLIDELSRQIDGYRGIRRERSPFDLTAREWEIARAAASRERSREIADRLGLSQRTVDNHLARIYRKLGVTGRDELRVELERMESE
ncbi:MAG TPA: LuxR family transcriptional regulator [Pseudolysinimonas sp.]